MASPFENALRAAIRGEVAFDRVSRGLYATDASHYQIMPACVVIPRDAEDAVEATRIAGEFRVPITPRGGGTSLSGQTTWSGMVLDCSKYMDRVLEINLSERWVRVQPGVVPDRLNAQLAPCGLHFAPDPATGNRANVGGMIGNNSAGTRSIVYGRTIDHVISCKVVLSDATVKDLQPLGGAEWRQVEEGGGRAAEIYRGVREIIERNRDEIARRFPKVMRRVSGYNLDAFLPPEEGGQSDQWNLSNLIVGSEGTLALLLEAKLNLMPLPGASALCVAHFQDVIDALKSVEGILKHRPSAVELLDHVVITEARRNPATAAMAGFLDGTAAAVLIIEVLDDSRERAAERIDRLVSDLQSRHVGYAWTTMTDAAGQRRVWEVRKLGLGLISNLKGSRKGQEFIEDACVPVGLLADYIAEVLEVCAHHGVPVTLYAHASVGLLHVRPMLDMHDPQDVRRMKSIAERVFALVVKYGGAWSGEHGDGLVRGEFIPRFFGPQIYDAFRAVKRLFDPLGLMNPGKIVDPPPMTENLRFGPQYRPRPLRTTFHYRDQGSFALAVEQCTGVGACRKLSSGTMCPSFMATRDEEHTTRGRANALRLAMSGQLGEMGLTGNRLQQVLELCLGCKACKAECPTAVDMARLKSEVLQLRHDHHGTLLSHRLLGTLPSAARLAAGPAAHLVNWLQDRRLVRWLMEKSIGIDRRRPLPPLATEPFVRWFRPRRRQREAGRSDLSAGGRRVVVFNDTFTNCYEPHIGRAAVELLESCGYVVELATACCQRPAISQGLLRLAKRAGTRTMRALDEFASRAIPILVLEPSCASALVDDLPDLIDDAKLGARVAQHVKMIDVFLHEETAAGRLECEFHSPWQKLLIHGHCHQKALFGTGSMKALLQTIPALSVREIDAGCCGMAGAFGYQHYDLSRTIGEDRLFPAVRAREPDAQVISCGVSSRHQLRDSLGVEAKHWVEAVRALG
jgi:FAD/FMN-containing dehydrogenase/Fe-S oxidoreductase